MGKNKIKEKPTPKKDKQRYELNKIIYLPCKDIWEAFLSKYNTIKEKISEGAKEITHLTNLRDTLLPKLMSGEIDVNDVEI